MVCWITEANEETGTVGMTFDEFIEHAIFFFNTQTSHEEGLQYVFELFDT